MIKKCTFATHIIIMLVLFGEASAQHITYPENYKSEIRTYLESLGNEDYKSTLIIRNILNNNHFDGKEIGIYRFFTLASHSRKFILFYNGDQIDIKKEYEPEIILKQSIDFINRYQSKLSMLERAIYYKNIVEAIIGNIDPPSMLPPPPKQDEK